MDCRYRTRRLDGIALYAALDARRVERGLSWPVVAQQTGVAVSTLQRTMQNGVMEADGVLAMALWLRCPLEDFILGYEPIAGQTPAIAEHRFDSRALHAALDAERRARQVTWTSLSGEIGQVSPAMLTRLAKGGRVGVPVMINAVGWLGRTVASFCNASITGRKQDGS